MLKLTQALILIFHYLLVPSAGFILLVDSYAEECFHEVIPEGAYLSMKFEVLDGGFNDIDAKLIDSHGHTAYHVSGSHGDHQVYRINRPGKFQVCFSNSASSRNPKLLMFHFTTYTQAEATEDTAGSSGGEGGEGSNSTDSKSSNSTELLAGQLKQKLAEVSNEMSYLSARWQIHLRINERSNESLVIWAFTEFSVVILLAVWQTYYLLRFFEVKRIV